MLMLSQLEIALSEIHKQSGILLTPLQTIEGVFGPSYIVQPTHGKKQVLSIRTPCTNIPCEIINEYAGVRYSTDELGFRIRHTQEIAAFCSKCNAANINVPLVRAAGSFYLLRDFVEGTPITEFLRHGNNSPLKEYFKSLRNAHEHAVIFGDRWGPNTIITPHNLAVNIDFDIELLASDNREFEIAQATYFSIACASNRETAIEEVNEFLSSTDSTTLYDTERISHYIQNYAHYFLHCPEYKINYTDILKLRKKTDNTLSTSSSNVAEKVMVYESGNKRFRLQLHPRVARPNYYTTFMAENIPTIKRGIALDVGVGVGIHSILMLSCYEFSHVDGIDINHDATRVAELNLSAHGLMHSARLFNCEFPDQFHQENEYDLIISEPPQIPTPPHTNSPEWFYHTNEGGSDGRRVIDRIIEGAVPLLKKNGIVQILHADFTNFEKTLDRMKSAGLEPRIRAVRKTRPGKFTLTRMNYIQSLGYTFQHDKEGPYFYLGILAGKK